MSTVIDPDDLLARCPIRGVLARVSDRWSLLVLVVLSHKTFRFGELKGHIPDISPRMLSQTLRQLEADGYITRQAFATVPPRVEYTISPLGRSFLAALQPTIAWADAHRDAILAARQAYVPPPAHDAK